LYAIIRWGDVLNTPTRSKILVIKNFFGIFVRRGTQYVYHPRGPRGSYGVRRGIYTMAYENAPEENNEDEWIFIYWE
jgi:hypothetical protein